MMRRHSMAATRHEWIEFYRRVGTVAVFTVLLMKVASPVQAQTFDQALTAGLSDCSGPPTGISPSPILAPLCGASVSSTGSTTALTRESSPVEERRVERLIGPFNVFLSGEYERFDKDVTRFEPGYKTDSGRAVIGADYSFSDRLLIGGAFQYGRDNGRFNAGGRFDTDSYGPLVHAIFIPVPNSFTNVYAGYMRKNYFISRIALANSSTVGTTRGDTDGNEFKVGVNGGYGFNFQNITIGPRLGLNYSRTEIDGYRERGNTGLELVYESQHRNSLTSTLGVHGSIAISTGFGVLVPQTTLEYVHEFQDPQRRLAFRFAEDGSGMRFRFQNDPPDRDYFNLGAGILLVLPRGFSPFLNYRALVGYKDQSSHIVTGGLRVEF